MDGPAGSSADGFGDRLHLSVVADPSLLATVRLVVASAARQSGISEELTEDVCLAASEIAAALVETGRTDRIEVEAVLDRGRMSLQVRSDTPVSDVMADDGSVRPRLLEALFPTARVSEHGSWSVTLDGQARGSGESSGNDGAFV